MKPLDLLLLTVFYIDPNSRTNEKKTKQHYIHTVQTLNFIYDLEMK